LGERRALTTGLIYAAVQLDLLEEKSERRKKGVLQARRLPFFLIPLLSSNHKFGTI
jgi:hypothetical protein